MHNKIRVIYPEWKEIIFSCCFLVILGVLYTCLLDFSIFIVLQLLFLIILLILFSWEDLYLSQSEIELVYCGFIHKHILWSDIERLEIKNIRHYPSKTILFIEHKGCKAYPKDATMKATLSFYRLRNFRKLNEVFFNYDKKDEQIKIIESFYPIANKKDYDTVNQLEKQH